MPSIAWHDYSYLPDQWEDAAEYLEEGDDQQHIPERFHSGNMGFATSDEQLEFRKYLCGAIYMFTFVEILCAILCAEEMGLNVA